MATNKIGIILIVVIAVVVLVVLAAAVAIVIAVKAKKKKKEQSDSVGQRPPVMQQPPVMQRQPVMQQPPVMQRQPVIQQPPVAERKPIAEEKVTVDGRISIIADGIRKNADSFDGLYEGVFRRANNMEKADDDALKEWAVRISNMYANDEFKKAFEETFDLNGANLIPQAIKLLNCIELAGVKRSVETSHTFGPGSSKKYICLGSGVFPDGTECTVVKPYWFTQSKVVEQGCVIGKVG